MQEEKRQLLQAWITKAQRDLLGAQRLAPDLPDLSIYHCQQAAEKAVKAVLVLYDQFPTKIHDIEALIKQASVFHPELSSRLKDAAYLSQYNQLYRYPEGPTSDFNPTPGELKKAYSIAKNIYSDVLAIMPEEIIQKNQRQSPEQEALETAQAIREVLNRSGKTHPDGSVIFDATEWRFAKLPGDIIRITAKQDNREILRVEGDKAIIFPDNLQERSRLKSFRERVQSVLNQQQQQQNQRQERKKGPER